MLVVLPEQALVCTVVVVVLGTELAQVVPGRVERLSGLACYSSDLCNDLCISNGISNAWGKPKRRHRISNRIGIMPCLGAAAVTSLA